MKFLAVDDKPLVLKDIKRTLEKALPEGSEILAAGSGEEALEIIRNNDIRIAFLDIEMPDTDGMELAAEIKRAGFRTNIFFVTGFEKYAKEAWDMNVCGFIMKPLTVARVRKALEQLKYPLHDLRIQCFGNFEVYYKDSILPLGGDKCKKILAYLVHLNGSSCTMGELITVLWEENFNDESLSAQLRTHIATLRKGLAAVGMEGLIVKGRNYIAVDTKMYDSDYFNYLNGDERAVKLSKKGYMNGYSWSRDF